MWGSCRHGLAVGVAGQQGQEPLNAEAKDIVGIRYQAMTGEDTASKNIEDMASVVVRSRVRELPRVLYLFVVTIFKRPINPIINPNPVSSQ
jgi:hypothetical protein